MALEEEIKRTVVSARVLDAVANDPAVLACSQGYSIHSQTLFATYYDTPDHLLLHHRLAFRVRQEGEGVYCATLKGLGSLVHGVSRQQEWEESWMANFGGWADFPAGDLRERITAIVGSDCILKPLLVTDFYRRRLVLDIAGSRAEMALDEGEIRANGAVHLLCEIELERLAGPFAPLQAFVAVLSQKYPLFPSQHSKFGWGLSLLGLPMETL